MYALDIDEKNRQEPLLKVFKAADYEDYSKITCKEAAKLQEKICKERKVNPR